MLDVIRPASGLERGHDGTRNLLRSSGKFVAGRLWCAVMSKPKRVLVVDDDPEIREYLSLALGGPGCIVQLAGGLRDVGADLSCDVALVDLLLEGGETAEPLIARLAGQGIRVVVMTGLSTDAPPVHRARAAGAVAILQKPFTLTALRDEVIGGKVLSGNH